MDTDPAKVPGVNDENVGSLEFSPGNKVMLNECSLLSGPTSLFCTQPHVTSSFQCTNDKYQLKIQQLANRNAKVKKAQREFRFELWTLNCWTRLSSQLIYPRLFQWRSCCEEAFLINLLKSLLVARRVGSNKHIDLEAIERTFMERTRLDESLAQAPASDLAQVSDVSFLTILISFLLTILTSLFAAFFVTLPSIIHGSKSEPRLLPS